MGKLGVFGEHVVTAQQACFVMPDEVPMEVAALIGCSVTTGVGAVINQPAAEAGMTVAVIGAGGVGLNAIQGAKMLKRVEDHRGRYPRAQAGVRPQVRRDRHGECAQRQCRRGSARAVQRRRRLRLRHVRLGCNGQPGLRLAGQGRDRRDRRIAPTETVGSFDLVDMVRKQKTMVGSYYGSASPHRTFQKLVDMYVTRRIDVDSIVQRRYPLDEINEAFHALERGEDGRGVIVYD